MVAWLPLILLVVVMLWLVGAYNGLIALKNQTVNAFKQIDVLIVEWRLKEWPFAGAAAAVLLMLAYTFVEKFDLIEKLNDL